MINKNKLYNMVEESVIIKYNEQVNDWSKMNLKSIIFNDTDLNELIRLSKHLEASISALRSNQITRYNFNNLQTILYDIYKVISNNDCNRIYKMILIKILYLIILGVRHKLLTVIKNIILNNSNINGSNEIIVKLLSKDNTYYNSIKENKGISNQVIENIKLFKIDEQTIEKSLIDSLNTIDEIFVYYHYLK